MDRKTAGEDREPTREERRKAALRANLQRRKAQARARAEGDSPEAGPEEQEA